MTDLSPDALTEGPHRGKKAEHEMMSVNEMPARIDVEAMATGNEKRPELGVETGRM